MAAVRPAMIRPMLRPFYDRVVLIEFMIKGEDYELE